MFSISFDGRVREDHLIGFFVPTTVLPGSVCSFQVTMTQPNSSGGTTVVSMFTFTQTVPADRHIVFTVPANVPLGWYHFTILCTVLSAPSSTLSAASSTTTSAASTVETTAADQAESAEDDDTQAEAGAQAS